MLMSMKFIAPGSLSYPNAAELTPPSSEKNAQPDASKTNGVATPAATPDAQNASGIIPTLQVSLAGTNCLSWLRVPAVVARRALLTNTSTFVEHSCYSELICPSRPQDHRTPCA